MARCLRVGNIDSKEKKDDRQELNVLVRFVSSLLFRFEKREIGAEACVPSSAAACSSCMQYSVSSTLTYFFSLCPLSFFFLHSLFETRL